ncbi:hypothetical protein OOT46_17860 [Aquabacterium sp. A7-Y]|uniref:hypothetical protein n=1 Tax=Aquabacterium sp. A7-Y TaxID=1349605 RepID=UPI00223E2B2A|nr:hypothetical protein [Aquabacterium sp. A7-Y]MCW7539707.1 hypothetical protein [Aquabacterium sp. A7-Y]
MQPLEVRAFAPDKVPLATSARAFVDFLCKAFGAGGDATHAEAPGRHPLAGAAAAEARRGG